MQTTTVHEGALQLHRAMGYDHQSSPLSWDVDGLFRAQANYLQCVRLAAKDDDTRLRVIGLRGWALARSMQAEEANIIAVEAVLHGGDSAGTFRDMHAVALRDITSAIASYDSLEDYVSRSSLDPEESAKINDLLHEDLVDMNDTKTLILATSFDAIPKTKVELIAFERAGKVPSYQPGANYGLTQEERCQETAQAARLLEIPAPSADAAPIEGDSPAPTSTPKPRLGVALAVTINPDGTLRTVHVAHSSGSSEVDEQALELAYKAKYVAARDHCKSVAGTAVIQL